MRFRFRDSRFRIQDLRFVDSLELKIELDLIAPVGLIFIFDSLVYICHENPLNGFILACGADCALNT